MMVKMWSIIISLFTNLCVFPKCFLSGHPVGRRKKQHIKRSPITRLLIAKQIMHATGLNTAPIYIIEEKAKNIEKHRTGGSKISKIALYVKF